MARPKPTDHPEYFGRYIALVTSDTLREAVATYAQPLEQFYCTLPDDKGDYAYANGKWTLKDLLQHIIDAERIFSYRMLRIVRGDKTPLASFDENPYAENAKAGERSFAEIKEEFSAVRKASDLLIASLNEAQLAQQGVASNMPVTANSIGYIMFGHMLHHKKVIEERYLAQ